MSEFRRYTAAFMFVDTTPRRVLLVRKSHPAWQDGLLNGIGGELHQDESLHECMRREFREETGFDFDGWNIFCREAGPGYEVYFYRMMFNERILFDSLGFKTPNENDKGEELVWLTVPVEEPCIGNLSWLVPMALDPRIVTVNVTTPDDIRRIRTW